MKDFDAAIKELEEANKLEPTAGAYASIGAIRAGRGRACRSGARFRKAVEVDPKNVNAHLALANFLMATGRAPAEQALKTALALDSTNPLANRGLAAFYMATRRAADAEPYLKVLAEQDHTPAATFKLALADFFAATNRPADAMKVLEPLSATKESFAPSRTRVAALQYSQKQTTEAHQTIDEVLAREPKNVTALLSKARFLLAERKIDEALKRAEAAVSIAPTSIQAQFLLGRIQRARRKPDAAAEAFNEVLKLNPRRWPRSSSCRRST